jgi:hypothetical protein
MSSSEISNENIVVASFDYMPEEVRKAFKQHKKAREEEMQELLACYAKDRCGSITQIKELVLPSIDYIREVHTVNVSHPSTYITSEDVSAIFSEHVKFTRNMEGEEIATGLVSFHKILNTSPQPLLLHILRLLVHRLHLAHRRHHVVRMPLSYFSEQTPPAHNTSMTLYTPEPVPISTIPPTSARPGQVSFVPPLMSVGAGGNAATEVRYTTPHAPQPPPPII